MDADRKQVLDQILAEELPGETLGEVMEAAHQRIGKLLALGYTNAEINQALDAQYQHIQRGESNG